VRICLVTLHATSNYGGVLQTYATQNILENFGKVKILDYRNKFILKHLQLIRFGINPRDPLRVAKDLCRIYSRYKAINKFKEFINKRMNLHVFNESKLNDIESEFDIFVAGSDQLWNPKVIGKKYEFDNIYLLNFVEGKRKISFASSIGGYDVEIGDNLISALKSFKHLSLRENDSAKNISKILDKEVSHVLDPTFFYDKNDWINMLGLSNFKPRNKKYVFLYSIIKDNLFVEAVNSFSKKLNLDIIIVDQDPYVNFKVTKHYKSAGPELFLSLFINAELIITNSFHGTAFAVNFEKPFYAILPASSKNRVISFLSSVGLMNRLISNKSQLNINSIYNYQLQDFTKSRKKLMKLKKISLEYLKRAFK